MASASTRSSRRAEGLSTAATAALAHNGTNTLPLPPDAGHGSLRKRARPAAVADHDVLQPKKSKLNGDIATRPKAVEADHRDVVSPSRVTPTPTPAYARAPNSVIPPPSLTTVLRPTGHPILSVETLPHEHRHTPHLLRPAARNGVEDKRKLRSQEGTRFKSELSAYFPDYDEVIGNDPRETHFFNLETPIELVDTDVAQLPSAARPRTPKTGRPPVYAYRPGIFHDLNQTKRVDFGFLDKHYESSAQKDLLPDSYYEAAHRKAERMEKSIRNTEKGRAQHERDQVIRLLDGLQGHDWLKVMGVSGITDTKKKEFEPARAHFIKGCEAILDKFRAWREEEKRRKLEKDRALARVAEQDDDTLDISDDDPPDYSDVDASAARQLHEEAIAHTSTPLARMPRKKVKVDVPPPEPPLREFVSFFKKPYLREAAMRKHRRSGRSVAAWGEPVPELTEQDFELPDEFRDEEFLKSNARRRRRHRRESKE